MKAVVCEEYGGPETLVVRQVESPIVPAGHVLVRGGAWGVNLPDALFARGAYQVAIPVPFSPGIELAGHIVSVGAGVEGLRSGMRVAAHPVFGAYAELVVVPANRVFPIPESVSLTVAAAFLINYGTSYNALRTRGRLTAGETLVVLGAGGGVGLAAVELGVAMGAKVVAVASTPDKRAACLEHGAHEVVDPTDGDLRSSLERLLGPRGVDVVIDPVGGAHTEPLVRSLAIDGRYLVVGFASGSIPSIALNLPLLKLTSIIGVHWGPWLDARPAASAVEMAELLALLEAGSLRPHVSATYPFDRAAEALAFVVSRASVGKVVLVPGAVA